VRHRKAGKKLGRDTSHRQAMLRNMVTSLFRHEQIETTDAKAKQLRPVAEKMITLAKRGDLHARRRVLSYMRDKATTHRLFEEIKDRYLDRQGGYVRVVKKGNRKGDGAPVSIIQLVPEEEGKKKGKKKGVAAKSGKTRPKQKAAAPAEKKETIEPKVEEKGETPEDQTDEEAK
jgi:large subunit ribosomal protein L17